MADDSVIHNVEAKEIESEEGNFHVVAGDAVISDMEIDTVLHFISSPNSHVHSGDSSPHFISSIANVSNPVETIFEKSDFYEEQKLEFEQEILISSPNLSSDSVTTISQELDLLDAVDGIEAESQISLEQMQEPLMQPIYHLSLNAESEINHTTEDSQLKLNPTSTTEEPQISQIIENIQPKANPTSTTEQPQINQIIENIPPEANPTSTTEQPQINQIIENIPPEANPTSTTEEPQINQIIENIQPEANPASKTIETETQTPTTEDSKSNDLITSLNGIITDDTPEAVVVPANHNIQVKFHHEPERLVITLPGESQSSNIEYTWSEIWQQLKQRLNAGDRFRVANTNVHLVVGDRLLDARQLQELAESLNEVQLHLTSVSTSRRQTAIASVTAGYSVEQNKLTPKNLLSADSSTHVSPLSEPLYMESTIRSGVEIRHPGTVTILGDVNPGGTIIADGDILIWGRLRGIAHAGARGNSECLIMALQMEPTQLRIADAVARAPEKPPKHFNPEVAYITPQGIRIIKASDFSRQKPNLSS